MRRLISAFVLRASESRKLALLAFLLTVTSTLFMGAMHGVAFYAPERDDLTLLDQVLYGLPFCLTLIAIVGSHELGHYLTARRYRVDSSLPVFVPFPFSLVGTLGAFIIIKSPFPHRRSLIDIGLAGPFAGFIVCVPALLFGAASSRPGPATALGDGAFSLGEPLMFQAAMSWVWPGAANENFFLSPVGLAAWFGLLLTAINLLPIGQLDGGHATYALFSKKAHRLSSLMFWALFPMSLLAPSWLFFALFAYALGIRRPHPPTIYDDLPLPLSRKIMGVVGLVVFALCFTPEPIQMSWGQLYEAFRSAR